MCELWIKDEQTKRYRFLMNIKEEEQDYMLNCFSRDGNKGILTGIMEAMVIKRENNEIHCINYREYGHERTRIK